MQDWTDDRYECIQYMLRRSDYHWKDLNLMTDEMLSDMVRHDLMPEDPAPNPEDWSKTHSYHEEKL